MREGERARIPTQILTPHPRFCARSYTSVNGTAFCESEEWIHHWARERHGFAGNVVTDCGALNMPGPEKQMDTAHNAAKALNAGTDLNCGQPWAYEVDAITSALQQKLVNQSALDAAVGRSLREWFLRMCVALSGGAHVSPSLAPLLKLKLSTRQTRTCYTRTL